MRQRRALNFGAPSFRASASRDYLESFMTFRTIFASRVSVLCTASLAVIVAGCAGRSLNPPQVIERSSGAQSSPATSATGAPPTAAPIDAAPVAVPTPIGTERVEQRPLGSPSSEPIAPNTSAPLKTEPLGVKRPYSDAAMSDLARADAGSSSSGATPATEVPAATAAAPTLTWGWPAPGKVNNAFGGKNNGIDILGKAGDPVVAAADGKVTFAGSGVRGYGNFVIVRHTPELLSVYANNKVNLVKEGTPVTRGQKIAEMGMNDTTVPHLHFEIRSDSRPIDPSKYLPVR